MEFGIPESGNWTRQNRVLQKRQNRVLQKWM